MLGATPDPRFHPKVVRVARFAPIAVAVVAAIVAAVTRCPISGY
jgi:hypothetical protein